MKKMAKVIKEGEDLNWKPEEQTCSSCRTGYDITINDLRPHTMIPNNYTTVCPQCRVVNSYDGLPLDHV